MKAIIGNSRSSIPDKGECADPIIEMLRMERVRRRASQREVADVTGIHHNSIAGYEAGHYSPNFRTLVAWAEALGFQVKVEKAQRD